MNYATRIRESMLYYFGEDKEDKYIECKRMYWTNEGSFKVIDEEIERVNSFEYIGLLIEADGDSTT